MRNILIFSILICLQLLWADTLVTQKGQVVVTAPRLEDISPSAVTVIDLKDYQDRQITLPEVLAETPGVALRQLGGTGSQSSIIIRGLKAENVRVYLDGVLLNQALGGAVNLGNIPLGNLEKIEVYRGSNPAVYSGSGIGGVINLISKKTGRMNQGGIKATYGSYNTLSVAGNYNYAREKIRMLLLGNYESSDNDFTYLDEGYTHTDVDDSLKIRENDYFQAANGQAKVDIPLRKWKLNISEYCKWSQKGNPGHIISNPVKYANYKELINISKLLLEGNSLLANHFKLSGQLSHSFKYDNFLDTASYDDGDVVLDAEIFPFKTNADNYSNTSTAKTRVDYLLFPLLKSSLITEYSYESFSTEQNADTTKDKLLPIYRNLAAATLNCDIFLLQDALMLGGVLHYDFIKGGYLDEKAYRLINDRRTVMEDYISGSINARYIPVPNLTLKLNAGKYYRMPSMFELFGNTGRFLGNQDLLPENGITADLGVRGRGCWFTVECSFFTNWVWDIISYEINRQILRPLNKGSVRIPGVETAWNLHPWDFLKLYGNFTWQYPVKDDGYLFPYLPLMDSFSRIEYSWHSFKFFCEFSFVNFNYKDGHNLYKTPARHMLTAGISKSWYKNKISTGMEVKNIYNRLLNYDLYGYPLPGRQVFLIIRYN